MIPDPLTQMLDKIDLSTAGQIVRRKETGGTPEVRKRILELIADPGFKATLRSLRDEFGYKDHKAIAYHIAALRAKGLVKHSVPLTLTPAGLAQIKSPPPPPEFDAETKARIWDRIQEGC